MRNAADLLIPVGVRGLQPAAFWPPNTSPISSNPSGSGAYGSGSSGLNRKMNHPTTMTAM